ncbi:MAG: single-stranded DNA-binding protein [Spirochaetes bacterium]|nr:single-stranded DNA-binding protein [Spirochaetota bacterium]
MRDINVVVLVGRLTRDSELKYTKSGQPIARFALAINRSVKRNEVWEDEASFIDIDFWGKGGEAVNRFLVKGQQVAVEGELRQDRWEQDGQNRSKIVVVASNVRLMGNAPGQGGQGGSAYSRTQPSNDSESSQESKGASSNLPPQKPVDNFDDDIPF